MIVVVDTGVQVDVFFFIGGRLCHRGSERLSYLSDVPCQLSNFSSLRPRGFRDFTSSGMNPPLTSGFLLMFVFLCVKFTKMVDFLKRYDKFCLEFVSSDRFAERFADGFSD